MSFTPAPAPPPRVLVEAPDKFLDGEDWGFDLTFNDPDTGQPMDLSGSRLWVAFVAQIGLAAVGVCDSDAADGSLVLSSTDMGKASLLIPAEGRSWHPPIVGLGPLKTAACVVGDIYRRVGTGDWIGLARATLLVLPTSGSPPA